MIPSFLASSSARPVGPSVRSSRAPLARVAAGALALLVAAPFVGSEAAAQRLPRVPGLPGVPSGPVIRGLGGNPKLPTTTQAPGAQAARDVPVAYRPPPGMCRIWLDNVPAAQQPAVTDCAAAVRSRPANGRVLFGDDYVADRPGTGATVPGLGPGTSGVSGPPGTSAPAPTAPPREGKPPKRAELPPQAEETSAPVILTALATATHGPASDDVAWSDERVAGAGEAQDTTARARPQPPRGVRPEPAPTAAARRPPVDRRRVGDDAPADDWEEGYAAGYEDAIRGRAPRVGGVRVARGGRGGDGAYGAGAYGAGAYGAGDGPGYGAGAGPGVVGVVPGSGSVAGGVVVVPPQGDPRYFNNGQFPPPGRANGTCLDRDGDGWCDDPRFGAPTCRDLDGDGRCDDIPEFAAAAYPSTLPPMGAAVEYQRGRGSPIALRWLGTPEVVVRLGDSRNAGLPTRALWFDANTNALLQIWTDRDADGVADRVEVFRNGQRVKLIGR